MKAPGPTKPATATAGECSSSNPPGNPLADPDDHRNGHRGSSSTTPTESGIATPAPRMTGSDRGENGEPPECADSDEVALAPFPFQEEIIAWALARDCAALFCDTGLGKALMQLKWARARHEQTDGRVLILAPLAVAAQTEREAVKFGIPGVAAVRRPSDSDAPILITNYDRFHLFRDGSYSAIVLDESSILKSVDSKTRDELTKWAKKIRYRLCCTATPAPNDHTELGNHAEFLGQMTRSQMLGEFFVHNENEMSVQHWRLKGHAVEAFWRWVAGWGIAVRRPSDLGYQDDGYILPPLKLVHEWLGDARVSDDRLFAVEARTLDERRAARLSSTDDRVAACAAAVALEPEEPWIIWCDYNRESEALTRAIPGAVEVKGPDSAEKKEQALMDFASGKTRVLVTKPSICGFGSTGSTAPASPSSGYPTATSSGIRRSGAAGASARNVLSKSSYSRAKPNESSSTTSNGKRRRPKG